MRVVERQVGARRPVIGQGRLARSRHKTAGANTGGISVNPLRTAANPKIKPPRDPVPIEYLPDVCIEAITASSLRKMKFLKGIAHRDLVLARNLVVIAGLPCALLAIDIACNISEKIRESVASGHDHRTTR